MGSETLCLMVLEQSTMRVGNAVRSSEGAADGDGVGDAVVDSVGAVDGDGVGVAIDIRWQHQLPINEQVTDQPNNWHTHRRCRTHTIDIRT